MHENDMFEMHEFRTGSQVPESLKIIPGIETAWFDYDGSGIATIFVSFPDFTEKEVEMLLTSPIKIGFAKLQGIVTFFLKVQKTQGLSFDFPIHPHVVDSETDTVQTINVEKALKDYSAENTALPIHFVLVDNKTRIIKGQRLVGTSNRLTNALLKALLPEVNKPISVNELRNATQLIQSKYQTADIIKLATHSYVTKPQ